MRTSDMKRLGEAWASVTSKKQEGYTEEEIRELCHSKDHNCAITVNHPEWGLGKPIYESHAIPTDDGFVEWYDVQFKHGVEKRVPVADMEVIEEANHMKKKKTETEDASNDQEDDGEGMDKVDPKAAKKKFKDRKDKDIDNDGDVDDSDEYLHKRRKAIGKAMEKTDKKAEISKIGEEFDFNDLLIIEEQAEEEGIDLTVFSEAQLQELSPALLRRARAAADQKYAKANDRYSKAKFHNMKSKDKFAKDIEKRHDQTKKFEKGADAASQRDYEKRSADDKLKNKKGVSGNRFKDDARTKQDRTSVRHVGASQAYQRYRKKGGTLDRDAYMKKYHGAGTIGGVNPRNTYESTELLNMLETAAKQQKSNATKPEGMMDKESPKSKEFANAHNKSEKKIEDNVEDAKDKTTKAGQATKAKSGKRPQDNPAGDTQVVKSTEAPVKGVKEDIDMDAKEGSISLVDMARDILSGKTMSELRQELKQDDSKNPYDGRLKTAKGFLERMNKRRGYEKKDEK